MPNGFGSRGGMGFGFRGSSPPWPYIGLGRGGLPRCGYFLSGTGSAAPGVPPATPKMTKEQELDALKAQSQMLAQQLSEIQRHIDELEKNR